MGEYFNSCLQCHYVSHNRFLAFLFNVWENTYPTNRCRIWCNVPDIAHVSWQNYAEKLKARLKWAYKVAKVNNDHEAARHKQYYDQKFKGMKIVPGDLVLVRVKAFGPDHKIADRWEHVPYKVLSQHKDSPVYKVQAVNGNTEESIHTLHRNMLFPLQSIREDQTLGQSEALVQADLAMMKYFLC